MNEYEMAKEKRFSKFQTTIILSIDFFLTVNVKCLRYTHTHTHIHSVIIVILVQNDMSLL